jgi:hypothetical protein
MLRMDDLYAGANGIKLDLADVDHRVGPAP